MPNSLPSRDESARVRPIAYVMEQTLGNITHYLNMRAVVDPADTSAPRWLPVEYRPSKLPWTVTAGWLARRTLLPVLEDVDGVFVHTMTLAPGLLDVFAKKPVVVSCDATPYGKRHMRDAYGLTQQAALSERMKRELYRRVLRRATGFVAWSDWAKQSLVRDYGCRDEDVAVISPGIDTLSFAPGDRGHALPRILFVGGDFVRKGGDLLLTVFLEHLRGQAELVIVTRDPVPEIPGVTVHTGIAANSDLLRTLYATSDVFALPTRADCYALACMEAMAAGLPVVATRTGGIPDMIVEGKTGHIVDPDDVTALARALKTLCAEPAKRAEMGAAAREAALRRFDARANATQLFEFVRSRC